MKPGMHIIVTEAEHNSVLRPLYRKEKEGAELTIVKADSQGKISLKEIEKAIRPNTSWVFVTHVSNVTGNLFPVSELCKLCWEREHSSAG